MAYVNSLSGSKLRSKMGHTFNEQVSAPTSSFARKQLEKMGWNEGEGIGKNREGMATHIKVKKRTEESGLGHSEHTAFGRNDWWNDTMGDTLSRLSGKKNTKKSKRKRVTDDELFQATGGKRFGMRAQRKAVGKWARTESLTEEQALKARAQMEWNGRGDAKIVLRDKEDGTGSRNQRTIESRPSSGLTEEVQERTQRMASEGNTQHVEETEGKPRKSKKEKKKKKKKEKKSKES